MGDLTSDITLLWTGLMFGKQCSNLHDCLDRASALSRISLPDRSTAKSSQNPKATELLLLCEMLLFAVSWKWLTNAWTRTSMSFAPASRLLSTLWRSAAAVSKICFSGRQQDSYLFIMRSYSNTFLHCNA